MSGVETRIARFERELQALDASLVQTTRTKAPATVLTLLRELEATTVAFGSDAFLREVGLVEAFEKESFGLIGAPLPEWTSDDATEWKAALAGADVGITAALGGSAETGTLLLPPHTPDERAVSLVPPVHIALLERDRLQEDVASLFALWEKEGPVAGSAVLVTGPSRTADIEKELVLGVHGPGALIVVLVG